MARPGLLSRAARAALAVAAAAALPACRGEGIAHFPDAPVVLVSIDTLRADHLPAYGYTHGETPRLDAFAHEAVLFENALSPVPLTLPAHASLLTGLLPPHHGVRDNLGFRLDPGRRTLAARLQAAGRPTGAAVSAFVLRSATGIAQGFDQYDDALSVDAAVGALGAQRRDGAAAVESLLAWVAPRAAKPFFAFLHLYEPHWPYKPPPAYQHLADPYDGAVAYADALVGRFLDGLRASGAYERAIIVVTSDHGEGLGQHGEKEHGFLLYREAIHVPLLVRLPGGSGGGRRVAGVARLVDVTATLLDLLGMPAGDLDGESLRPAFSSGKLAPRSAYAETFYPRFHFGWSELVGVSDDRYHFIRAPRPELYDLKTDTGERDNLAAHRPEAVAAMEGWLQRTVGSTEPVAPEAVPAEVAEKLRALGYVGGSSPTSAAASGARADPKDKLAVYEAYREAAARRLAGDHAAAVAALRAVLQQEPQMSDAWEDLGASLMALGRVPEGLAALERALAADPGRATAQLAFARALAVAGKPDAAIEHATAAASQEPGAAFELLAELRLARGELAPAAEAARRSLAADSKRAIAAFVLGVVEQRGGRCAEAIESFQRAAAAQALQKRLVIPGLHARRGDCLARLGRTAEAEAEFRAELAQIPYTREGRVGLALVLQSQGRGAEIREVLAGIVTAHPRPGADEYWAVVRTLAVLGDRQAAGEWAARAHRLFPQDARFSASRPS